MCRRLGRYQLAAGLILLLLLVRTDAIGALSPTPCPGTGSWIFSSANTSSYNEKTKYDAALKRTLILEIGPGGVTVGQPFSSHFTTKRRCTPKGLAVVIPNGGRGESFYARFDKVGDSLLLRSTVLPTVLQFARFAPPPERILTETTSRLVGVWRDGPGPLILEELTFRSSGEGEWYGGIGGLPPFRWKIWPCSFRMKSAVTLAAILVS